MVAELGPGRFYGGGLPRPRVFPGGDRADPPALLSWAREAQWSTGARGGRRLRLQGRIEGSLGRLRRADALGSDDEEEEEEEGAVAAQECEAVDGKESEEDKEESGESEEVALVTPARGLQRKKPVAAASAPSAEAPAKVSPKRKAAAAALTAGTAPTRKRKAAKTPAARTAKH
ncbi:hypothetical protein VPH35_017851 [Triticum aestivum]